MCVIFFVFLSALFLLIKIIDLYHQSLPSYEAALKIGGPPPLTFCQAIKLALTLNRENIFSSIREDAKIHKKSYVFWCLGQAYVRIIKAEDMEKILASAKHTKKGFLYRYLQPFLREGLLLSYGKKWIHRRKILTPAFHFNILQQFLKIFQHESRKLVHLLNTKESLEEINIPKLFSTHTLNVICETAMGVTLDSQEDSQSYRENIHRAGTVFVLRFIKPWLGSDFIFKMFGYEKMLNEFLMPIHSFTRKIIHERRAKFMNDHQSIEGKKERHAMLDTLLWAQEQGFIDLEGIREEVDTFTFEGHDTTASAITMILLSLAENQHVQEQVYGEISKITTDKEEKSLEIFDYTNMTYTDRVIKECLRLYPPVPYITRELTEDQEINGHVLPAGALIEVHIFDLHRDPQYFPNPEHFDPDRFLPENVENRHPFAYLPFSAGPRNCIGQKFALLEIKTVIESILINFHLSPITKREDLVFVADLVLRTVDPIKIKFSRR
ncbi:Cytochrome P450 [Sergentomyia squamirostris]